jgi:hypothetical protein
MKIFAYEMEVGSRAMLNGYGEPLTIQRKTEHLWVQVAGPPKPDGGFRKWAIFFRPVLVETELR